MKNLLEKLKICYYVMTSKYYAFFSVRRFEYDRPKKPACYISSASEKSEIFMECVEKYSRTVIIKNLDIESIVNNIMTNVQEVKLISVDNYLITIEITSENKNNKLENILTGILKRKVEIIWKSLK